MDAITLVNKVHTLPLITLPLQNGRLVNAIHGQKLCENFSIEEIEHLVDTVSIMRLEISRVSEDKIRVCYSTSKVFEINNHYMVIEKKTTISAIRNLIMVLSAIFGMLVKFTDWSVYILYNAMIIILVCAFFMLGLWVAIGILQVIVFVFTAFVLKHGVWILPNALREDDLLESLKPLWVWAEKGSKAIKKE